ncbi:MAG: hypothetical protein GXP31_17615 [Kiritimatiellaeota bacterium]|nr:hypothetical protein [Kiritimatiellota bacterium]
MTQIVREALVLGRFDDSAVLKGLNGDMDSAAKEAKKLRVVDEIWREESLPRFPSFVDAFEPSDFDSVPTESFSLRDDRPRVVDAEILLGLCDQAFRRAGRRRNAGKTERARRKT